MNKRNLKITYYVLLVILFAFANLVYQPAFAQDSTPPTDDEVNAIAKQLYCPVCENTPLDVCPTEACRDWREHIRLMLSEGKTEDEILQYFVDQYGDRVLSAPPATGFNWLIYLLPPIIILIGAVLLFRSFKEWTKPKVASPVSVNENNTGKGRKKESPVDAKKDDYVTRLEEELKKRK
jgi:cytochrome c-type biogenesis protein CcmH